MVNSIDEISGSWWRRPLWMPTGSAISSEVFLCTIFRDGRSKSISERFCCVCVCITEEFIIQKVTCADFGVQYSYCTESWVHGAKRHPRDWSLFYLSVRRRDMRTCGRLHCRSNVLVFIVCTWHFCSVSKILIVPIFLCHEHIASVLSCYFHVCSPCDNLFFK